LFELFPGAGFLGRLSVTLLRRNLPFRPLVEIFQVEAGAPRLFEWKDDSVFHAKSDKCSMRFWSMRSIRSSAWGSILSRVDASAVSATLAGSVPERLGGGILIGLGALFFIRAIAQVVLILSGQLAPEGATGATLAADLVTTPVWVVGGILLWRKRPLGHLSGLGLLFQASMLFIGLLIYFILQPILNPVPFPLSDFLVILVMGLVCFIPFGLFVRGVVSTRG
jgi:hypothetical protein